MGEGGSRTYLTLAGSPRPEGKLVDMICTKHKPFTVSSDSAGARPILQHALEIIQLVNNQSCHQLGKTSAETSRSLMCKQQDAHLGGLAYENKACNMSFCRARPCQLACLPTTLRKTKSAAPLKTCRGHCSEDESLEPMLPGSLPQQWHRLPRQLQRFKTQLQCRYGNLGNVAHEYSPAQATCISTNGRPWLLDSTNCLAIVCDAAKEYSQAT